MTVKKIYREWRLERRSIAEFRRQTTPQVEENIRFYNLWDEDFKEVWFYRFLKSRHLLEGSSKRIAFYSVFGSKEIINYDDNDIRCFFSAENVHAFNSKDYAHLYLNDPQVGLSMAFDFFEDEKYLRLPTWVLRFFSPEASYDGIVRRCNELSRPYDGKNREKFVSLIASWDPTGLRQDVFNQLSRIGEVDCPGKWNHNDDSLKQCFSDDKKSYLSTYRYNICPENSNAYGYVTEKLFDAVDAGCVPIYWGSYNRPEQDILNQEAILFWNDKGSNEAVIRSIEEMERNPGLFEGFSKQDRLLPHAADVVFSMYESLEEKLKKLIQQ